jgi:putative RNA 2'-phosphotransferase
MNIIKEIKKVGKQLKLAEYTHKFALDADGFALVSEVLEKTGLSIDVLNEIVLTDDRQSMMFNEDKTKVKHVKKNEGSKLEEVIAPEKLFHGTTIEALKDINRMGLDSMYRNYVHMSDVLEDALKAAQEKGKATVLEIDAKQMSEDGIKFFKLDNGVWLTEEVAPKYIKEVQ